MAKQDLEFWHHYLGHFLSDMPAHKSSKAAVPTRLGKEGAPEGKGKRIAPNVLGAGVSTGYIITPTHAWVIGRIAMDNTEQVSFVATDSAKPVRDRKYIATWLVEQATAPFMVGMIGNASPNSSFRVSPHIRQGFFCEAGGGYTFNLDMVRKDVASIGDLAWKLIGHGIHAYDAYRNTEPASPARAIAQAKLVKLLEKTPALRSILPKLFVRPHSGDYELLRLYLSD